MKEFQIITHYWIRTACTVMSCAVLGLAVELRAGNGGTGVAPVKTPRGGFGIDGDPAANTPEPGVGDWTALFAQSPGAEATVLDAQGKPVDPAVTCLFRESTRTRRNDGAFSNGSKWGDDPNTWRWTPRGSLPEKSNLGHGWLHASTDGQGQLWFILGASRAKTVGSTCIEFEFLQNKLENISDGTFRSQGPHGGRTLNDLLVSLAFREGGRTPEFKVYRWQADAGGGFDHVELPESETTERAFAAVNDMEVTIPDGGGGSIACAPGGFSEIAINLTALLGGADPCLAQSIRTVMVKTRASSDRGATLEDFLEPLQDPVRVANAGADQLRLAERTATSFRLQAHAAGSLYPIAATSWSVVEGDAGIESPESLATDVRVRSIGARLRFTVEQENGCVFSDEVTLTVLPPLLDISMTALGQLQVRWPVVPQQYVLESSLDPGLREWNSFEGPVEESEGHWRVTLSPAGSQRFFRLRGEL